jgi:hypothetical protein
MNLDPARRRVFAEGERAQACRAHSTGAVAPVEDAPTGSRE